MVRAPHRGGRSFGQGHDGQIEKSVENSPIFKKTGRAILKFEIKNSKKIRDDFKFLDQNRIQKFKVTNTTKFRESKTLEKINIKIKPTDFL
jgi:hypothetical protein